MPVLMTTEACQGGQPLLHDVSRAGENPDVLGRWHGHITMPEGALRLRRRPGALSLTDSFKFVLAIDLGLQHLGAGSQDGTAGRRGGGEGARRLGGPGQPPARRARVSLASRAGSEVRLPDLYRFLRRSLKCAKTRTAEGSW